MTEMNGAVYFTAFTVNAGNELWKSDGTSAGTVMVRDIRSGIGNSSPFYLTNVNGTLYFSANDGTNGIELWKSDGTTAGTVMVRDILSGSGGSVPRYLTNVNGTLYFRANDGTNGEELWKSDGTTAGTVMVRDIRSGTGNSFPRYLTNVNGTLYFTANDGTNGEELWKSDGTTNGTQMIDVRPGALGSNPSSITSLNGWVVFSADDGISGKELWISDGSTAGTGLFVDPTPGGLSSDAGTSISIIFPSIYFDATTPDEGRELWRADVQAPPFEFGLMDGVLTLNLSSATSPRNLTLKSVNGFRQIIDTSTGTVLFGPETDLFITDLIGLKIEGSATFSETLTIDHSTGIVDLPRGVTFSGGTGGDDRLVIIGSSSIDVTLGTEAITSGSNGQGVTVSYTQLEGVSATTVRRVSGLEDVEIRTPVTVSPQFPVDLGAITTLSSSSLTSSTSISLGSGEVLTGGGTLIGRVSADNGSLIRAIGNMTLGTSSSVSGFTSRGELETGTNTVTLLDSNQAVLGSLTTLGNSASAGTIQAANGALIDFGNNLIGFGTVETPNLATKVTMINGAVQGDSLANPITLTGFIKGVGKLDNVSITGT